MKPCSNNTSPENTYCYDSRLQKSEVCPITNINFQKSDSNIKPNSTVLQWEEGIDLVFSKDSDNRPITETRIDELQPCI